MSLIETNRLVLGFIEEDRSESYSQSCTARRDLFVREFQALKFVLCSDVEVPPVFAGQVLNTLVLVDKPAVGRAREATLLPLTCTLDAARTHADPFFPFQLSPPAQHIVSRWAARSSAGCAPRKRRPQRIPTLASPALPFSKNKHDFVSHISATF